MAAATPALRQRLRPTARGGAVLLIASAGVLAAWVLGLKPSALVPNGGGMEVARKFFAAAFSPALTYESADVPEGTMPLPAKAALAAWTTLKFAAAGTGVSVILGVVLGFLASSAWWEGESAGRRSGWHRVAGPVVFGGARIAIAVLRSVHELIWAVLFLAAAGLSPLAAVLALALPFAGTLAKIFSEMVDEAPRSASGALRSVGARPLQVYAFALLPQALPDILAYALYRFECALRSSAIMGFLGIETFGYFLKLSFENLHYREVWTYLYALAALVITFDIWSGAIRRRLVGHALSRRYK
ncbi:MAG: ABC transporter permease subunit [Verrucomicrobiales bacterium]